MATRTMQRGRCQNTPPKLPGPPMLAGHNHAGPALVASSHAGRRAAFGKMPHRRKLPRIRHLLPRLLSPRLAATADAGSESGVTSWREFVCKWAYSTTAAGPKETREGPPPSPPPPGLVNGPDGPPRLISPLSCRTGARHKQVSPTTQHFERIAEPTEALVIRHLLIPLKCTDPSLLQAGIATAHQNLRSGDDKTGA